MVYVKLEINECELAPCQNNGKCGTSTLSHVPARQDMQARYVKQVNTESS